MEWADLMKKIVELLPETQAEVAKKHREVWGVLPVIMNLIRQNPGTTAIELFDGLSPSDQDLIGLSEFTTIVVGVQRILARSASRIPEVAELLKKERQEASDALDHIKRKKPDTVFPKGFTRHPPPPRRGG